MNRREKATRENGEQWRYDYNARGEVTSGVKAKSSATNAALSTGMQFGYDYDLIGNRIEESVHTPAGLAVQDWTANAGNQITQREIAPSRWLLGRVHPEADLTVTGGGTAQREDWEFAVPVESTPAGAATWKQVTVAATREGAGENGADLTGNLVGNQWFAANPESLTYDADGNLSSDGRWSYQWDGENRLKVMQTQPGAKTAGVPARRLEFAYDAQGRRIRKLVQSFELAEGPYITVTDHRYIYHGWNMVAEFEVQGSPELTGAYAWGRDISGTMTGAGGVSGLVLAQKPKTGWTYAPCYDGNGNISAYVSAASGAVRAKFDYDPYGRPIWNELAGGEELPAYRFSTKYEDVETGLLYYGYRYYASEQGRWISRDPIEEDGGINLYGMVGNDALSRIDYVGLRDFTNPGRPDLDYPGQPRPKPEPYLPRQYQIETALAFDVAILFSLGTQWEDVVRAAYFEADKKLLSGINKLVAEGIITKTQGAQMYVEGVNKLVVEFRDKSTPVGKYIAEKIKPSSNLPTYEKLITKGKTDASLLTKAHANRQVTSTVGKFAQAGKACGAVALAFQFYKVSTAEPAARPRILAGTVGGIAGGASGAWAFGHLGGKAGTAIGGPPGGAVGGVSGVIIGGIGGSILGELAAQKVYDVIVIGDVPLP